MNALEELGGKDFVDELASQFIKDGSDVLDALAEAAALGDLQAFREQLHACAAPQPISARAAFTKMCLGWRHIAPEDFAIRGEAHLKKLNDEFERVRHGFAWAPLGSHRSRLTNSSEFTN